MKQGPGGWSGLGKTSQSNTWTECRVYSVWFNIVLLQNHLMLPFQSFLNRFLKSTKLLTIKLSQQWRFDSPKAIRSRCFSGCARLILFCVNEVQLSHELLRLFGSTQPFWFLFKIDVDTQFSVADENAGQKLLMLFTKKARTGELRSVDGYRVLPIVFIFVCPIFKLCRTNLNSGILFKDFCPFCLYCNNLYFKGFFLRQLNTEQW